MVTNFRDLPHLNYLSRPLRSETRGQKGTQGNICASKEDSAARYFVRLEFEVKVPPIFVCSCVFLQPREECICNFGK